MASISSPSPVDVHEERRVRRPRHPPEDVDLAVAQELSTRRRLGVVARQTRLSSSAGRCARRDPSGSRRAGTSGGRHRPTRRRARPSPALEPGSRTAARAALAVVDRRRRLVVVGRVLAQLDQHEVAVGVVADADQAGAEQRLVLFHGSAVADRRGFAGASGSVLVDAVEELLGLGREQGDLLLLDEDRQERVTLARLDDERSRAPGSPNAPAPMASTGSNSMWSVTRRPPHGRRRNLRPRASAAGSGSRSSRPPVSLHFTSMAPYVWKSKTVADAGETCTRWNRSRCMPV